MRFNIMASAQNTVVELVNLSLKMALVPYISKNAPGINYGLLITSSEPIQKLTFVPKLRKNDRSPEIGRQPSSKFWFENFECAPSRTKTWSSLSTSKSMA